MGVLKVKTASGWIEIPSQGPPGDPGPPGPPGAPGAGASFTHTQSTPASVWTITHNMGFYPAISIVDSANDQVEGEVTYNSANVLTVTFSSGFSGKAYLS